MNRLDPVAAIKNGWKLTKDNFIVSLGLLLGYMVVSMLLGMLPVTGFVGLVCQLLVVAVSMIWSLGICRFTIEVVDGEEPRFGVFQDVLPRLLQYVVMSLIMLVLVMLPMIIIVGIGAITCGISMTSLSASNYDVLSRLSLWLILSIIPGVYFSIRFYFASYLLVDRGVGAIEALKMSWKATDPLQGKIFAFMLLLVVVGILGLICFIVGVIVSMIVAFYAQATLYRQAFPAGLQDPLLVEDANVVVG